MYEHKIIKANDTHISTLQKEWWGLVCIDNWKMYFKKKITKTVNKAIWDKNKEWLEFRNKYKEIKDSWLSSNSLIVKYNKLTKEWLHTSIINNLDDYKKHLEVHKKKDYALMAQTYINQKRYLDNWEIIKVDFSTKWRSDLLKERKIPPEYCELINLEAKKWDANHWQTKEMTVATFENIITSIL